MYSVCILIYESLHLCIHIATHLHTVYLDWLQAVPESSSRCTWKWWLREFRDSLWGCDRGSLKMDLEAVIPTIWRYTWKHWSTDLRDSMRDCDRASLEMHLEVMLFQTSNLYSSKFADTLAGRNRARLDMHLEAMIERVWWCTQWQWSSNCWDMHLEAVFERVWRCTWRQLSCELGGCTEASL